MNVAFMNVAFVNVTPRRSRLESDLPGTHSKVWVEESQKPCHVRVFRLKKQLFELGPGPRDQPVVPSRTVLHAGDVRSGAWGWSRPRKHPVQTFGRGVRFRKIFGSRPDAICFLIETCLSGLSIGFV